MIARLLGYSETGTARGFDELVRTVTVRDPNTGGEYTYWRGRGERATSGPEGEAVSAQAGKPRTGTGALLAMLWAENPVFAQILGICSALAVTNLVRNTLVMGAGLGGGLAIAAMAGIREKMAKRSKVIPALEGPGIALVIAGIMALAFVGFSGMIRIN